MNSHKIGLVVGLFFGLWHAVWEILIALGLAQPLMNFVMSMHSLNNPYKIASFNLGRAIGLIVMTYIIGYIVGSVFATIYKKFH